MSSNVDAIEYLEKEIKDCEKKLKEAQSKEDKDKDENFLKLLKTTLGLNKGSTPELEKKCAELEKEKLVLKNELSSEMLSDKEIKESEAELLEQRKLSLKELVLDEELLASKEIVELNELYQKEDLSEFLEKIKTLKPTINKLKEGEKVFDPEELGYYGPVNKTPDDKLAEEIIGEIIQDFERPKNEKKISFHEVSNKKELFIKLKNPLKEGSTNDLLISLPELLEKSNFNLVEISKEHVEIYEKHARKFFKEEIKHSIPTHEEFRGKIKDLIKKLEGFPGDLKKIKN